MSIIYRTPVVHCMYGDVSFDTPGLSGAIILGSIPIGGRIVGGDVFIVTAFNASGTNNMNIGWTSTTAEYFTQTEIVANVLGRKPMVSGVNNNPFTAAHSVVVRCSMTPAGITAGRALIMINWIAL